MTTIVQSSWLGAISGAYEVAANWSPSQVPTYGASPATEYDVTLGPSGSGTAFTVTSSANEQVGFLTVNPSATFNVAGGTFAVYSTVNFYSIVYNFGKVNILSGATMKFGVPNSPPKSSSEIDNLGTVNISGTLSLATHWFGLKGSGAVVLSNGHIVGGAAGTNNSLTNITNTISGSGSLALPKIARTSIRQ